MKCRHCGDALSAERAELGYDYCTREACVDACFEPVQVVAVAVNKASDQYVLKRDLGWSEPRQHETRANEGGWLPRPDRASASKRPQRPTTVRRIAELEAQLEADLAREDDPAARAKLVNDFNARIRQFNIRYRREAQRRA